MTAFTLYTLSRAGLRAFLDAMAGLPTVLAGFDCQRLLYLDEEAK
jgi:hypothetical protein